MSSANKERDPYRGRDIFEIQDGISFNPYKGIRGRFPVPKGRLPFYVPEEYCYGLAVRKWVSYHGTEGFIDIISEDPVAPIAAMIENRNIDQPLGITYFGINYRGRDRQEVTREPGILRFSFLPQNPADYARLLNSYVDIQLGDGQYLLAWNLNRIAAKKNLELLEQGEKPIIVEKNLLKDIPIEEPPPEPEEEKDFGRISYVWIPLELKPVRSIKMTFNQLRHDQDLPLEPMRPEKPRDLILM